MSGVRFEAVQFGGHVPVAAEVGERSLVELVLTGCGIQLCALTALPVVVPVTEFQAPGVLGDGTNNSGSRRYAAAAAAPLVGVVVESVVGTTATAAFISSVAVAGTAAASLLPGTGMRPVAVSGSYGDGESSASELWECSVHSPLPLGLDLWEKKNVISIAESVFFLCSLSSYFIYYGKKELAM